MHKCKPSAQPDKQDMMPTMLPSAQPDKPDNPSANNANLHRNQQRPMQTHIHTTRTTNQEAQSMEYVLGHVGKCLTESAQNCQPDKRQENHDLSGWLESVITQVERVRGIVVEPAQINALYEHLHTRQYNRRQAAIATEWIMRGNWQFRGAQPRLQLSDFFPTAEQVQSLADSNMVLLPRTEYAKRLREAYHNGQHNALHTRATTVSENVSDEQQRLRELQNTVNELTVKLYAQQHEYTLLRQQADVLSARVARLHSENISLRERVAAQTALLGATFDDGTSLHDVYEHLSNVYQAIMHSVGRYYAERERFYEFVQRESESEHDHDYSPADTPRNHAVFGSAA